jgi:hypothetical protein
MSGHATRVVLVAAACFGGDRRSSIALLYPSRRALSARAVELSFGAAGRAAPVRRLHAGSVAWTSRFDAAAHAHADVLPTDPAAGIVSTLFPTANSPPGRRSSAAAIFLLSSKQPLVVSSARDAPNVLELLMRSPIEASQRPVPRRSPQSEDAMSLKLQALRPPARRDQRLDG